jgi:hypothetical protein
MSVCARARARVRACACVRVHAHVWVWEELAGTAQFEVTDMIYIGPQSKGQVGWILSKSCSLGPA